jgi:hypothetical protein
VEEKQKGHFEAEKLELAEEKVAFYKRALGDNERVVGLNHGYVEYLEWADAEKTKIIKELEKKYQDVLDGNLKDFEWMHQEVNKNQNEFLTCSR